MAAEPWPRTPPFTHIQPLLHSASVILNQRLWFPDPTQCGPEGLVAFGGDLSVQRLLLAYRCGIFPWSAHPITWWSPDPRAIFELDRFHVPRSLARLLHKRPFEITIDLAFPDVITQCAIHHREQSWIGPEFIEAYCRLHDHGAAHSVEVWQQNRLVGGVYGVAVGGLFAGESMFHTAANASKVALCHLTQHLREHQFTLFDIQMLTPVTEQLGAREIPRSQYLRRLADAVRLPCRF